jgi:hypothetical protein
MTKKKVRKKERKKEEEKTKMKFRRFESRPSSTPVWRRLANDLARGCGAVLVLRVHDVPALSRLAARHIRIAILGVELLVLVLHSNEFFYE